MFPRLAVAFVITEMRIAPIIYRILLKTLHRLFLLREIHDSIFQAGRQDCSP